MSNLLSNRWTATIAQFLLGFLLLPVVCLILSALGANNVGLFLSNLLQAIPFIGPLTDTLSKGLEARQALSQMIPYCESVVVYVSSSMLEACVVGMCVYVLKLLGRLIGIKGAGVIQTILGIFLGAIAMNMLAEGGALTIVTAGFLCVLAIVVTLVLPGLMLKKVLAIILLGYQCVLAGFAATYVAALVQIAQGVYTGAVAWGLVALTFIPLAIALLIDHIFLSPLDAWIL